MSKEKKPFKETKLGKWLSEKAPKVLDIVGDVLPDKGVLGIVKNLIDRDDDVPAEQKLEFAKLLQDHEKEMFALEVQDRDSARARETDFIKSTGHLDWMMTFIGVSVMASFFAVVYFVATRIMPEGSEHLLINAMGILEGMVLSVVGYYYGSSAGSRIKDMKK